MIQAVLFDLGETLVSYEHVDLLATFAKGARETYDLLASDANLKLPEFDRYLAHQLWAIRWAYFKSKFTGHDFNSVDILSKCMNKLKINVPETAYAELVWRWYKPLADQSQLDPEAFETLADIQRRGLKLGLISNTFVPASAHDRHLAKIGLLSYFPVRVYSCELGIRKPKKEIFWHALNALAVGADQAVYVGDKFDIDVRGARRAGMFAVLKSDRAADNDPGRKTYCIRSLRELPDLIDCLQRNVANRTVSKSIA